MSSSGGSWDGDRRTFFTAHMGPDVECLLALPVALRYRACKFSFFRHDDAFTELGQLLVHDLFRDADQGVAFAELGTGILGRCFGHGPYELLIAGFEQNDEVVCSLGFVRDWEAESVI